MADISIISGINANAHKASSRSLVRMSATVGYQFYVDSATDLVYKKTTDNGANWGSAVVVHTGTLSCFDVWYEKWTPGDTGTKIHIAITDSAAADILYRSLDTAGDTLGTEVVVFNGASFVLLTGLWDARCISITKARGGNLMIFSNPDSAVEHGVYRSIDGGANWTTRTTTSQMALNVFQAFPANTSDPQDVLVCYISTASSLALTTQIYDDSANTYSVSASGSTPPSGIGSTTYFQMSGAVRHSDNHVIVYYWTQLDNAASDLVGVDCNPGTVGAPGTVRALLGNVITDTAEYAQAGVCIDQNTNDIYVCYLGGGTWATSARVFYKKSTDGGTSWGTQTQIDANALADQRALWCDLGGTDTAFAPSWNNIDLTSLLVNVDNSVPIAPPAAATSLLFPSLSPGIRTLMMR